MSKTICAHLRGNVVGYVAIFLFAMSAPAIALPGSNTVFTDDIVNGEVQSGDIGTNEVTSADIANGTVATQDIATDGVTTADILNGEVTSADVLDADLTGADLANNSVSGDDIQNETLATNDLQANSVQTDEIENETIGSGDIGPAAVGASEVGPAAVGASEVGDGVVARVGTGVNAPGGAAENGAYTVVNATASCLAGEELIGGSGQWSPDNNSSTEAELWLAEVRFNAGAESVSVDGGNDSGVDHDLQAVAWCLTV
jgi:hypothetical protein